MVPFPSATSPLGLYSPGRELGGLRGPLRAHVRAVVGPPSSGLAFLATGCPGNGASRPGASTPAAPSSPVEGFEMPAPVPNAEAAAPRSGPGEFAKLPGAAQAQTRVRSAGLGTGASPGGITLIPALGGQVGEARESVNGLTDHESQGSTLTAGQRHPEARATASGPGILRPSALPSPRVSWASFRAPAGAPRAPAARGHLLPTGPPP